MARIAKDYGEDNKSPAFIKSNEILKRYILKRNLLIRLLLILIAGVSYFLYQQQIIANTQYLIYFLIFNSLLFLFSFIFLRTKLINYQDYHNTNLCKNDKQAIARYNDKIKSILSEDSFRVLNNLYLPCGGEYLQQLDSVIIALGNIYIVELLNLEGVIEGMASGDRWKNNSGEEIMNNYQQNKKHVNEIEGIVYNTVPNEEIEVNNLVINLNMNSNFNMPDKGSHPIFDNLYDALYWIKNKERNRKFEIDDNEREIITQRLFEIHHDALSQVEYNLNEKVIQKYNLEDEFLL